MHILRMAAGFLCVALTLLPACGDAKARRILCFGDSLTAGPQLAARETYPARLQAMLSARGYPQEVVNAGVSGDTTEDGLERIDAYLEDPADILILELGTNDAFTGVPAQTIQENLGEIIKRVQAKGITVVLLGIEAPPQVSPEYREQLPPLYRALARQYNVLLIPDFMRKVRETPGAMRRDGVHYKARGAEVLAEMIFEQITPLLPKP